MGMTINGFWYVIYIIYPLVIWQFAAENGPVEIVTFPINSMVDLSIVFATI